MSSLLWSAILRHTSLPHQCRARILLANVNIASKRILNSNQARVVSLALLQSNSLNQYTFFSTTTPPVRQSSKQQSVNNPSSVWKSSQVVNDQESRNKKPARAAILDDDDDDVELLEKNLSAGDSEGIVLYTMPETNAPATFFAFTGLFYASVIGAVWYYRHELDWPVLLSLPATLFRQFDTSLPSEHWFIRYLQKGCAGLFTGVLVTMIVLLIGFPLIVCHQIYKLVTFIRLVPGASGDLRLTVGHSLKLGRLTWLGTARPDQYQLVPLIDVTPDQRRAQMVQWRLIRLRLRGKSGGGGWLSSRILRIFGRDSLLIDRTGTFHNTRLYDRTVDVLRTF